MPKGVGVQVPPQAPIYRGVSMPCLKGSTGICCKDDSFPPSPINPDSKYFKFMKDEIEEIEKYKWIRSEQEGRDLDEEACEEWVNKYARRFREEWENKHGKI